MKITYIEGKEETYDIDFSEAIYKKYHPNVFIALTTIGSSHFDHRVVPMLGVRETKIKRK